MSKLLVSKKSSAPGAQIGVSISFMVIGIILFILNTDTRGLDEFGKFAAIAAPILTIIASVLVGVTAIRYTQCYINVYDDHIEG